MIYDFGVVGNDRSLLPGFMQADFVAGMAPLGAAFEIRIFRVIGVDAAPRLFADFVRVFTRVFISWLDEFGIFSSS